MTEANYFGHRSSVFHQLEIKMNEQIILSIEDSIATITLNRPDKLNAISLTMLEQLENCIAQLENNREVRAVIITGAGDRAFSVGADIK